jgi:hypothetical protein
MSRWKNFAQADLSSGVASGATSISVSSATNLPTETPLYIVLYNKTDSPDILSDANKETVKVTAISGTTLTVNALANNHNTAGKTYSVIALLTAEYAETFPKRIVLSSQLDKTNTTFTDIPGFVWKCTAGTTIHFRAVFYTTLDATGSGNFNVSSGATLTSIIFTGLSERATAINMARMTSATAYGANASSLQVVLEGTFSPSSTGDFKLQFAQTSASGTSSLLVGSYVIFEPMSP